MKTLQVLEPEKLTPEEVTALRKIGFDVYPSEYVPVLLSYQPGVDISFPIDDPFLGIPGILDDN